MKVQEKLTYTNERGESIVFSPASSYHVNFKDVTPDMLFHEVPMFE